MPTAGAFRFKEGDAPDSPPSGEQYIYIKTSDHKLYRKDSSGTETAIDSSGSGTTIASGSSFPLTPAGGDYFFRTDLGRLFRYSGTAWDSVALWLEEGSAPTGTTGRAVIYMDSSDHRLYAKVHGNTAVELGGGGSTTITAGTTFPGSPASGDYFFRTDLGRLFRYNGTAWDTEQQLWLEEVGTTPAGAAGRAVIYASSDHTLYARLNGGSPVPLSTSVTVQEQDGTPSVAVTNTIKFPNGSVTDEGSGVVAISTGAPLTVQEVDGSPSVSGVSVIRVSNGTLTDDSGGQVTLDTSGGGGSSISAGTSFPLSPTAGDYYFHTGHDGLFRYSGSVWEGVGAAQARARNVLINGGFAIFQRQDPATLTTWDDDQYGPDRWYILSSAANCTQVQRIAGDTQRYACRLKQTSATAQQVSLAQIIEGANCWHLRGKEVTLRVRVRCSAGSELIKAAVYEWAGTEDDLTTSSSHDFVTLWDPTPTLASNLTLPSGAIHASITTTAATWQELTFRATLGSSFNNLVVFLFASTTLAQDVLLDIEAVQLEAGSVATPFESLPISDEVMRCQWYYRRSWYTEAQTNIAPGIGSRGAGNGVKATLSFAPMRIAPTFSKSAAGDFNVLFSTHSDLETLGAVAASRSAVTLEGTWTTPPTLNEGNLGFLRTANTTSAWLALDAEL